jgi:hypothetical protein
MGKAKAKGTSAAEWVMAKLREIAAREAAPLPEPSLAATSRPKPTSKREPSHEITRIERPEGVPLAEWEQALANVRAGSAPCTLTAEQLKSTEPSDETVARWRRQEAYAASMQRQQNMRRLRWR